MLLKFNLTENQNSIAQKIMGAIKQELNEMLLRSSLQIQTRIRNLFREKITKDDTWKSLQGDKLMMGFGLPFGEVESRLNEILDIWLRQIIVDYKTVIGTNTLQGGIKLYMLETDFEDVMNSEAATVISNKGFSIEWLRWLLTYGDKIIIADYELYPTYGIRSRSGLAIMVKKKGRGRWRVPPEFSGTINNNFITKILDNMGDEIDSIVTEEINKRFI